MAPLIAANRAALDSEKGKRLFEQQCIACHEPSTHYVYRSPTSRGDLRALVALFQREAGLGWTTEDIDDVVEYLNRIRYQFPSN